MAAGVPETTHTFQAGNREMGSKQISWDLRLTFYYISLLSSRMTGKLARHIDDSGNVKGLLQGEMRKWIFVRPLGNFAVLVFYIFVCLYLNMVVNLPKTSSFASGVM